MNDKNDKTDSENKKPQLPRLADLLKEKKIRFDNNINTNQNHTQKETTPSKNNAPNQNITETQKSNQSYDETDSQDATHPKNITDTQDTVKSHDPDVPHDDTKSQNMNETKEQKETSTQLKDKLDTILPAGFHFLTTKKTKKNKIPKTTEQKKENKNPQKEPISEQSPPQEITHHTPEQSKQETAIPESEDITLQEDAKHHAQPEESHSEPKPQNPDAEESQMMPLSQNSTQTYDDTVIKSDAEPKITEPKDARPHIFPKDQTHNQNPAETQKTDTTNEPILSALANAGITHPLRDITTETRETKETQTQSAYGWPKQDKIQNNEQADTRYNTQSLLERTAPPLFQQTQTQTSIEQPKKRKKSQSIFIFGGIAAGTLLSAAAAIILLNGDIRQIFIPNINDQNLPLITAPKEKAKIIPTDNSEKSTIEQQSEKTKLIYDRILSPQQTEEKPIIQNTPAIPQKLVPEQDSTLIQQQNQIEPNPKTAQSQNSIPFDVVFEGYKNNADATEIVQKLRQNYQNILANYTINTRKIFNSQNQQFFNIYLGPFNQRSKAEQICAALIAAGEKECTVTQRSQN